MNSNDSFFKKAIHKIKEYLLPIILGLAVALFIFYYIFKIGFPTFFLSNIEGFKEMFGISLAILSSGTFLAVLKWFQFMGFFRSEIHNIMDSSKFNTQLQNTFHDVLYSDEFLQNRKDIEDIWRRVTKCYFKSELTEEISNKLNKKLGDVFLHNSKLSHFFRSCIITLNIDIDSDGFLTIDEVSETTIVRPNTTKFIYDFCYFVDKLHAHDSKSNISMINFSVNGIEHDLSKLTKEEIDEKRMQKKLTVNLEGNVEYNVVSKTRLVYNIDPDNTYVYFSERVTEYFRVEVNFGLGLNLFFVPIGNETFIDVEKGPNKLIKVYKNLLLPERGFRLIFVKS